MVIRGSGHENVNLKSLSISWVSNGGMNDVNLHWPCMDKLNNP